MSKAPITKEELLKIIQTTQEIEGYKKADKKTIQKAKEIKAKYEIKVSLQR